MSDSSKIQLIAQALGFLVAIIIVIGMQQKQYKHISVVFLYLILKGIVYTVNTNVYDMVTELIGNTASVGCPSDALRSS